MFSHLPHERGQFAHLPHERGQFVVLQSRVRYRPSGRLLMFALGLVLGFVLLLAFGVRAARGQVGEVAEDESKARAALALAKAKRQREAAKAHQLDCHTDYAAAAKAAEQTGKRMVVWCGLECTDYPELRLALASAVHVHVPVWRGDRSPGIMIRGGDGIEYWLRPEKIDAAAADRIKRAWAKPYEPPKRGDAGIGEDLSRAPFYKPSATGWLAWNGSAWVPSQSGPPASYQIVGYEALPAARAPPATAVYYSAAECFTGG
jgi:hypothetical protein